jgi:hypothetical protein
MASRRVFSAYGTGYFLVGLFWLFGLFCRLLLLSADGVEARLLRGRFGLVVGGVVSVLSSFRAWFCFRSRALFLGSFDVSRASRRVFSACSKAAVINRSLFMCNRAVSQGAIFLLSTCKAAICFCSCSLSVTAALSFCCVWRKGRTRIAEEEEEDAAAAAEVEVDEEEEERRRKRRRRRLHLRYNT